MNNQNLFDKYHDGNHWYNHPTIYAEVFAELLQDLGTPEDEYLIHPAFCLVDLGCGNGRDVNHFATMCIPAIGFDNDAKVLQLARETYPKHIEAFYPCDIEQLPFTDNTRFAYFCINVMHYVDQKKVLREIYRTLRPGGYAFIHFNLLIIDQDYSIDYHQKKSDVYELLKDFEIVEEKTFLREDTLPAPHTHHVMQVILKKNLKQKKSGKQKLKDGTFLVL